MTAEALPNGPGRRGFIDRAIRAGLVVCGAGMAIPSLVYLLPARRRGPKDVLVPAGPAEDFEPGTARMIQGEGRPIMVLNGPGGKIRAFSAICTHLGCIVHWDPATGRIVCPCHAGFFGPDGKVISGPPPRPLPEYEVVRTDGEIQVKL